MPIETFKRRRRCRVNAKLRNCQIISFIIRATSVCEWVCGCVRAQERRMRLNVLQFARREYQVAEKEVRRFVDVVRVFHMFLFSVYLGFSGLRVCVRLFVRRRYRYVQNIVIRTVYVKIPAHRRIRANHRNRAVASTSSSSFWVYCVVVSAVCRADRICSFISFSFRISKLQIYILQFELVLMVISNNTTGTLSLVSIQFCFFVYVSSHRHTRTHTMPWYRRILCKSLLLVHLCALRLYRINVRFFVVVIHPSVHPPATTRISHTSSYMHQNAFVVVHILYTVASANWKWIVRARCGPTAKWWILFL